MDKHTPQSIAQILSALNEAEKIERLLDNLYELRNLETTEERNILKQVLHTIKMANLGAIAFTSAGCPVASGACATTMLLARVLTCSTHSKKAYTYACNSLIKYYMLSCDKYAPNYSERGTKIITSALDKSNLSSVIGKLMVLTLPMTGFPSSGLYIPPSAGQAEHTIVVPEYVFIGGVNRVDTILAALLDTCFNYASPATSRTHRPETDVHILTTHSISTTA